VALTPGSRIGSYEITAQIGVGGMGEVYRATDTDLKRQVAVKVLPEAVASDTERLARFQREAEVLASLNHPNIAAIFGLARSDGQTALVMELVEGPTLADRIAQGPVSVDEALSIAKQIAEALEAAHEQGIVHRDLKPANVKVRPDGTVKVLDFGLAKAMDPAGGQSPGLTHSPTITTPAMTQAGLILGTAAYMSPEQARGSAVDKRSDIWAFGCVLYEMLTGRATWVGQTATDVIAAAVATDADLDGLPAGLHPRVREVVARCLEKDPLQRFRDMGDVRVEIARALQDPDGSPAAVATGPIRSSGRERLAWALAVVGGLATAVALALGAVAPDPGGAEWFMVLPPHSASPVAPEPAVSPDGESIVFRARSRSGDITLWVRRFDEPFPRELAGTEEAYLPFWSPDGQSLGFFAPLLSPSLRRVDLAGRGQPQTLARVQNPRGADWGESGLIVIAPRSDGGLYVIPASGGELRPVTDPAPGVDHWHPHFLPGGRRFLFLERDTHQDRFTVFVGSVDTDELVPVGNLRSRATYRAGYLFFGRGQQLFTQRFDVDSAALSGEPVRLADDVGLSFGDLGMGAFSVEGDVLVHANGGMTPESQLVAFDREGRRLEPIGEPGEIFGFSVGPDERTAALEVRDPEDNTVNVWSVDLLSGDRTRISFSDWWAGFPVWSPDGDRLVYLDDGEGLLAQRPGQGTPELLRPRLEPAWDWSRDGQFVVAASDGGLETQYDLELLPLPNGDAQIYSNTAFKEWEASVSPDSRWMAYSSDKDGAFAVYVDSFPTPGNERRVAAGRQPLWREDGAELYYLDPENRLTVAGVQGAGARFEFSAPKVLFEAPEVVDEVRRQYAVLGNGQRFIFNAVYEGAEPRSITVVRNWKALVEE